MNAELIFIFQDMLVTQTAVVYLIILARIVFIIIRAILVIAFTRVYKIPFLEAVDSSIRITTFKKEK